MKNNVNASWGTESMHTSFVGHGVCERGLSRHRPGKLCRAHKMVTRPAAVNVHCLAFARIVGPDITVPIDAPVSARYRRRVRLWAVMLNSFSGVGLEG